MKNKAGLFPLAGFLVAILFSMLIGGVLLHAAPWLGQLTGQQNNVRVRQNTAPIPFMHRPYYGSQTIGQRTVSFVDHDKPWYENDGIFVRYDGAKWTNTPIGSCTGGVNCYDGHNGYDLNLHFEPVLSAAAGTVIRAGWYDPLNHNNSLGLWVAVDHHNGYYTAYGHLSALTVSTGDQVGTQWQVGTSGTTGSSTGPHLHMATYYAPNWNATDPFGWTGNYPDPNVVADNYLWVSDPGSSSTIPVLSANGNNVYPGATLVDDGASGWSSTGGWTSASSSDGIRGDLHWTYTTSGAASATATWQPQLPADGYYEVGVFVDSTYASSSWAPYTIYSTDPNNPGAQISHSVYLDESHIGAFQGPFSWENTGPQWVSLGTYYFRAGMSDRVVLSNATGENGAQIAADGVEFVPVNIQSNLSYRFAITADGTPQAMLPGSTTNVNLALQNTSNFTWSANSVQVIYRWLNAQNQIVATGTPASLPQDVSQGANVTVTVPVQAPTQAGTYTVQWDMVQGSTVFSKQGASVKNDTVNVARYSEVISPASLPTTLTPGATVQLNVSVKNTGILSWPSSGSSPVTLGYTWLDSNGHPIAASIAGLNATGTLSSDVAPGESTTIPIILHTPVLAGSYILVYDLQQGGSWFASQGATPLRLPVTITTNLPTTYYFAEGYTGPGTTETLSLVNPLATQANITITYLYQNGTPQTRAYTIAAQSHSLLNINQEAGANQSVSMIVRANQPFVAERTMYTQKDGFISSSDSMGASGLSTTWYFAEGNTTPGWSTLLSVMNPSSQPATMKITYLLSARGLSGFSGRQSGTYTLPAQSRSTIVLNQDIPNQQFGMAISASTPVMVERPEYLTQSPERGGSAVVGATSPQTTWYFGAGNTSPGFTERLVLANPASGWVHAQITYLLTNGQVMTQQVSIRGQSRAEVDVNSVLSTGTSHATQITADAPIIAERQDFFNANITGTVVGSTTVMGTSSAHTSWYIAQGDTTSGHVESLALANPNTSNTQVQVVYYRSSGAPLIKQLSLAANTSTTLNLMSDVGPNQFVGAAVYATLPVVVEQTMFYNVQGASGGYACIAYGQG